MKFGALAFLLASVCCVIVPINGQAARKNASTGQAKTKNAQTPKIDSVDVGTVNVTKLTVQQQAEPAGKADNDSKESKPYLYRLVAPENLPNLILCLVGIAAVVVAICTLKGINGQLGEMQGTKAVMETQSRYIVNTERAWVMGELGWYEGVGPNIEEGTVKGAECTKAAMKLTCKNQGKSPAWIDNVYTRLDIASGGSLVDEIDRENLQNNGRWGALSAGETRSQSVEFFTYGIRATGGFLSAFVIVEYRDIFDIKRETFLGYSIDAHGNVYRQDGLPNRNRNT